MGSPSKLNKAPFDVVGISDVGGDNSCRQVRKLGNHVVAAPGEGDSQRCSRYEPRQVYAPSHQIREVPLFSPRPHIGKIAPELNVERLLGRSEKASACPSDGNTILFNEVPTANRGGRGDSRGSIREFGDRAGVEARTGTNVKHPTARNSHGKRTGIQRHLSLIHI